MKHEKMHFFTPSLAVGADTRRCLWQSIDAGPDHRLWWAEIDGDSLVNSECLAEIEGLVGDCELIPSGDGVFVAWAENDGGGWRGWVSAGGAVDERVPLPHAPLYMRAVMGPEGNGWLAYQTTGFPSQIMLACVNGGGQPQTFRISQPGLNSWKPALCATKSSIVVAWDSFAEETYNVYLRQISPDGDCGPIHRVTEGRPYDRGVSVCPAGGDDVWLSWMRHSPWSDSRYYRLCMERDIYCRHCALPDGDLSVFSNREGEYGGRVPIPLEYRGQEAKLPLNPKIVYSPIDHSLRILFRQIAFDDAPPESGRTLHGWHLKQIVYDEGGWSSKVDTVSGRAGYSSDKMDVAVGDEGITIAYGAVEYPGRRRPPQDADIAVDTIETRQDAKSAPQASFGVEITSGLPKAEHGDGCAAADEPEGRDGDLLLFGDLHRHTDMSHCVATNDGNLWDHFRWAQDVAGLGFYALTDHLEQTNTPFWYLNATFADLMHADGDFLCLYGMEVSWSDADDGHRGHFNIFCCRPQVGDHLRQIIEEAEDISTLYDELDSLPESDEILIIKHFHALHPDTPTAFWQRPDAESFRPEYEPVIEVVQNRGFNMEVAHRWLRQGLRIGFIGGTDHGRPHFFTYRTGPNAPYLTFKHALTGVWVEEKTRAALLAAIHERKTFATNGQQTVVELRVNGCQIGGSVEVSEAPRIWLKMRAPRPLVNWTVYRDGEAIEAQHSLLNREGESPTEIEVEFEDEDCTAGRHYYHAEVQHLAERGAHYHGRAVTSPVWVEHTGDNA